MHFLQTNSGKHLSKSIHHFAPPQEALAQYQTKRGRCQNKLYPYTSKFLFTMSASTSSTVLSHNGRPMTMWKECFTSTLFIWPYHLIKYAIICAIYWLLWLANTEVLHMCSYPIIKSGLLNYEITFPLSKHLEKHHTKTRDKFSKEWSTPFKAHTLQKICYTNIAGFKSRKL